MVKKNLKLGVVLSDGKRGTTTISDIKDDITDEELVTEVENLLEQNVLFVKNQNVIGVHRIELIETQRNVLMS